MRSTARQDQTRPDAPVAERLLSRADVRSRLCVSEWLVDNLIRRGELVSLRIGDRRLVREQDLIDFIAARIEQRADEEVA
jgi:hypothetical protein